MLKEVTKIEDGSWGLKSEAGEAQVAELEQRAGALAGLAKTQIFGLPIGAAATGLLVVGAWDVLRGFVAGAIPAAIPGWAIPAIGAYVVSTKTVRGFAGTDAANAAGLMLLADAVQAMFNVRGLVSGLFGKVTLGQTMKGETVGGNGSRQITSIAEYNALKGIS